MSGGPTNPDLVGKANYEGFHGGRPPVPWDKLLKAEQERWIAGAVAARALP
jgi:hypothetical protein